MAKNDLKIIEKVKSTMSGREGMLYSSGEIIDMILQKFPDTNPSSIIPSDYCYNIINKDIINFPMEKRLFEYLKRNTYKYLGPGARYNGTVYWKGSDYGKWENGKFRPN